MDTLPLPCDPSLLDVAEVSRAVNICPEHGLTSQEAANRLLKDGQNVLRAAPKVPAWQGLLAQFQDPLIYLLLVAVAIALLAWAVGGFEGLPVDALVIAMVLLLNGALGYMEEAKARDAVAALARMTEAKSTVMRDGHRLIVDSADLVLGDMLVLVEGDAVGADARLTQALSLRLLEAPLTGESEAVLKNITTLPKAVALGDRLNMVFKGTAVAQGSGLAIVTATGMATQIGAIASLLKAVEEEPTPLEKEIAHIGRLLGAAVIVIAVIVVSTILLISNIQSAADVVTVLLFGVALAVAAVPEGLPAILSVVLAMGVRRMADRKAIVKKLSSVEALGSATVIATDKTGTLTRSEMTIERVITASGGSTVTGAGYVPNGQVQQDGIKLAHGNLFNEQMLLLTYGCLAGNSTLAQSSGGQWMIQGDPTEAAFFGG